MEGWKDNELGDITVVRNVRARRCTMRPTPDGVRVSCPFMTPLAELRKIVDRYRDKLARRQREIRGRRSVIDTSYSISTDLLRLCVTEEDKDGFYVRRSKGESVIICPRGTDYSRNRELLEHAVAEELRKHAKQILPARLAAIAAAYGFKYKDLKIQSSKSRWGSCSGRCGINLSLYLMRLPSRLVDYVIKHELCHTVHHDHSPKFWALLDKVSDHKSDELKNELKTYYTEI